MGVIDFATHLGSEVVAPYLVERFVGGAGAAGGAALHVVQLVQPPGDFSDPALSDLVITTPFSAHRGTYRNGNFRFFGQAQPGQWTVFARGVPNTIIVDDPSRFVAVAIPAGVVDPLLDRLWPDHQRQIERLHARQFSPVVPQLIARFWNGAAGGLAEDAGRLYCDALITVLIGDLMQAAQAPAAPFRGGLAAWQMRRVSEYLEAHFHRDVALGDLAALCGLSDDHFARAFRRSFGIPPHRYQLRMRLEHAKALLADPAISVAAVAAMVGFARPQGLTRLFLRELGVPPLRYRRDILGR